MKQTNNALTFLMAQYRAIFKNAYFKGIASAMVLTAGLATGQAMAADTGPFTINNESGGISSNNSNTIGWENVTTNTAVKGINITGDASESGSWSNAQTITLNLSEATNLIKAGHSDGLTLSGAGVTINLSGSGLKLTLDGATGDTALEIANLNIGGNTLELNGTASGATTKATTISLGNGGKISLNGADTNKAVIEGKLAGTGTLDFAGNGTISGAGTDGTSHIAINVAATKGGLLNLAQASDTFITDEKINLAESTSSFTIQKGILDLGTTARTAENFINKGTILLSGAAAGDATLKGSFAEGVNLGNIKVDSNKHGTFTATTEGGVTANITVADSGTGVFSSEGTFTLASGGITVGSSNGSGSLSVTSGTLTLGDAATLSAVGSTNLNALHVSGTTAALQLNGAQLKEFVNDGTNSGSVVVDAGAITVTGDLTIDDGTSGIKIDSGTTAANQTLLVEDRATLNLYTDSLTIAADASGTVAADIKTKTLTLGAALSNLDITDAIITDKLATSGSAQTIKKNISLDASTDAGGDGSGTITGTGGFTFSGATATITGAWTADTSVTLSGANAGLEITKDSSLTFSGANGALVLGGDVTLESKDTTGLTIESGAALTISGTNAKFNYDASAPSEFMKSGSKLNVNNGEFVVTSGTLNLADVTVSGDAAGLGSIVAKDGGIVSIDEMADNVAYAADSGGTLKGATLEIKTAEIATNITETNKTGGLAVKAGGTLEVDNLTFTDAAAAGVTLNPKATLKVTTNLTSQNAAITFATGNVNLAAGENEGTLAGNGFVFQNKPVVTGNWTATTSVTLSGADASLDLTDGSYLSFSGSSGDLIISDNATLSDTAGLSIESGAALTVNGTDATVNYDAASAPNPLRTGSNLKVIKGDFVVTGNKLDLTGVKVTGDSGSLGSIIAKDNGVVSFEKVNNIAYGALEGGTIKTDKFTATSNFASDNTDLKAGGVYLNGGTFSIGELTLNGTSFTANGTVEVTKSLKGDAAGVTFTSGILSLKAENGTGLLDTKLTASGTNVTNVQGSWTGTDIEAVDGGTLNVGLTDGTAGNLKTNTIKSDASSSITVNKGSVLTVNGDTADTDNYGFNLSGATVTVNDGTFVIGSKVAGGLNASGDYTGHLFDATFYKPTVAKDSAIWTFTDSTGATVSGSGVFADTFEHDAGTINAVYDNFGKYNVNAGGKLQIDFASGMVFTKEQYAQIREELLGVGSDGAINIGDAKIAGITDGDSNGSGLITEADPSGTGVVVDTIDYSNYAQVKGDVKNLDSEKIKDTQMVNVAGSIDTFHVGALQLAAGTQEATFVGGESSINGNAVNIKTNSEYLDDDGNKLLIVDADGNVADAHVMDGATLTLNSEGAVGDVKLEAGNDKKQTTLTANNKNLLNSVGELGADGFIVDNTRFVVGSDASKAETTVTTGVYVSTLNTKNGSLTIQGNDLPNSGFYDGKALGVDNLNNGASGSITVEQGDVHVGEKITNAGSIDIKDGALVVLNNVNSTGSITVSDTFASLSKLDNNGALTVNGNNLDTTSGNVSLRVNDNLTAGADSKITVNNGSLQASKQLNNAGSIAINGEDLEEDADGNKIALTVSDNLTNSGSASAINVAHGNIVANAKLANEGSITIAEGILTANDKLTNAGAITVGGTELKSNDALALEALNGLDNTGDGDKRIVLQRGSLQTTKLVNDGSVAVQDGYLNASDIRNTGNLTVSETLTAPQFKSAQGSTTEANRVNFVGGANDEININGNMIVNVDTRRTLADADEDKGLVIKSSRQVSGKTINATINGDVNAQYTSADLSNVTIANNDSGSGSLTTYRAYLTNDIKIDGSLTATDGTFIGLTNGNHSAPATQADADPSDPTDPSLPAAPSGTSASVLVTGHADLGRVTFANFTGNSSTLAVRNGAVTTKDVIGAAGTLISVGSDTLEGDSGTLEIQGKLYQNGTTLVVDPRYDKDTALVAVGSLNSYRSSSGRDGVGIFQGNVFVGQNSALGIGVTQNELKQKLNEGIVAQSQKDGHFIDPRENKNGYGAMLYLDNPTAVESKYGVVLTSDSMDALAEKWNQFKGSDYAVKNVLYLGNNTALALNTDNAQQDVAYFRFIEDVKTGKLASGSQVVADGGDIVLYGHNFSRSYKIFDDNVTIKNIREAGSDFDYTPGTIKVISANGVLVGELNNGNMYGDLGQNDGTVYLHYDVSKLGNFLAGASSPIAENIKAYVNGYNGELNIVPASETDDAGDASDADNAGDASDTKTATAAQDAATTKFVDNTDYLTYGDSKYYVNNEFLSRTVLEGTARDAEVAAKMVIYGGAAQSALSVSRSTAEAITGRLGAGSTSLTIADNMQGGTLWVTPLYKSMDSDGFDTDGLDYGVDVDFAGLALGADFTLSNGIKLGAAFNVGSGDADGDDVSNDFDYYSFAIYGGWVMNDLSVIGDLSYTQVSNDIEGKYTGGTLSTSPDSTAFSLGVTGAYTIDLGTVQVTPHAGLRFTSVDVDDYSLEGVGEFSADTMSVFSVPVGVTISGEFAASNGWSIKPMFDATIIGNFGDNSLEGNFKWANIDNLSANVSGEVIDDVTYGATVGVEAKTNAMSLGFGINYTGSSNTDEFGINANARFVF